MEPQHVTKIKYYICLFFISLISVLNLSFAQNNNDYYTLYKGGELFLKPIVYLQAEGIEKTFRHENYLFFEFKKNTFKCNLEKQGYVEIDQNELRDINFVGIEELYKIEEQEFKKRRLEVENEKGFRPIPPIEHKILKIYIIKKHGLVLKRYEVEWTSLKF